MRKKKKYHWLRGMRHANERRAAYVHPELVRGKRKPCNLPNPYDDKPHCHQKSWKVKRKKQYRGRADKIEFNIRLDSGVYEWDLAEYFDEHDIPFRMKPVREDRGYYRPTRIWKKSRYVPVYTYTWDNNSDRAEGHQIGWEWEGKWVDGPMKWYPLSVIVAYDLTYWHHKEVGIDYILNSFSYMGLFR
jgi:hypothetical protein